VRVTAIVPLYNKARFIRRALDSILAQTHADLDVVVVDDGSVDGSADIVRREYGSRVTLLDVPHGGASRARNTGVAHAATEWVALLDADDQWRPGFVERSVALARAQPALGAVFTNRTNNIGQPRLSSRHPSGEVADYFRFNLQHRVSGIHSSSLMVRKRALVDCGGFPEGVERDEDLDTWARLAWTVRVGYVPDVLSIYHVDGRARVPVAQRIKYPQVLLTYRAWRAAGRIPPRLEASSEQYALWMLLWHASCLVRAGLQDRAREVLREEYPVWKWPRYGSVRTYLAHVVAARLWPRAGGRRLTR
jgi:glycosyltransferase involved in cell wall biosynthesis